MCKWNNLPPHLQKDILRYRMPWSLLYIPCLNSMLMWLRRESRKLNLWLRSILHFPRSYSPHPRSRQQDSLSSLLHNLLLPDILRYLRPRHFLKFRVNYCNCLHLQAHLLLMWMACCQSNRSPLHMKSVH